MLKTCIKHNADAIRCGCSLEMSQADSYRYEKVVNRLPPIARLAGDKDYGKPGPWVLVFETRRE